jgi:hypothetical protein
VPISIKIFLKSILISFCLFTASLNAQILRDSSDLSLVKKAVDNIYNLQFREAAQECLELNHSYPGHPIGYLLKGMMAYWENYPLIPSSPAHASYEADLRQCINLCEKKHEPSDNAEYLLANLCARGMLLLYYADNDLSMEVIPLTTSTYQYIRHSFDYTSVFSDFYFFTGLYDYYREVYPDAYPVYKALAFLFPKGDRNKGFKDLQTAAKSSIVLKAESASFLYSICLSYENDFQQASSYTKSLHERYPANMQYLAACIKNLLLVKQYDEAEKLILSSDTTIKNPYFQSQLSVFKGILQEKKYKNPELARQYYEKGIEAISAFGVFGNEYAAYAYFGLSRLSEEKGDRKSKKYLRKRALELAEYKKVDFD